MLVDHLSMMHSFGGCKMWQHTGVIDKKVYLPLSSVELQHLPANIDLATFTFT
jgi:hypothetical protein